jgi:hypothetical protein
MAKLIIHEKGRATVHEILETSLTIGRKDGVSVKISDPDAATEHCQITLVDGVGYKLVDLESRSGTKVNGAFVNQHLLKSGDVIQVGGVRIDFAGEAPVAAPAPTPAPPPIVPSRGTRVTPGRAAAVPPRPAVARPPVRPGGPPPDREPRPPRSSRPTNAPIIILGVIVGLLLFFLAILVFVSPWFHHGHNQTVFEDMRDLYTEAQGQSRDQKRATLQQVLDLAATADPGGDKDWLAKIAAMEEEVRAQLKGQKEDIASRKAWIEFNHTEIWAKENRNDLEGIVARWEQYLDRYRGAGHGSPPLYVLKARQRLKSAKEDVARVRGAGGNARAPARTEVEGLWREAQAAADAKEREDYFGEAIEILNDFMDENRLKIPPSKTPEWEQKVAAAVRAVESRAENRWETLRREAIRQLAGDGGKEAAIEIYQRVMDRFGILKYVRLAQDERNRRR